MRESYISTASTQYVIQERLHSRFLQVPDYNSFVKVTLTEHHRFHTAVQVFKVLYQLSEGI